jgi:hypothetical protein
MNGQARQSNDQPSAIFENVQDLAPIPGLNLNQTVVIDITQDPKTLVYTLATGAAPITATLQYEPNPNGAPAITGTPALMPTIAAVNLYNDKQQLIVDGDFGGSFTTRSITIGGTPVPATWTSGSITVNSLPLSGPGSGGEILVTIDKLTSNQVMLQQWNSMQLTMFSNNGTGITGQQRTVTCTINLRGSFDALRNGPDLDPSAQLIYVDDTISGNPNGQCTYVATGTPSGSGVIPWSNTAGQTNTNFAEATGLETADGNGGGTMALQMQAAYTVASSQGLVLDTSATTGNGGQPVAVDSTQSIAAGMATQTADTLGWGTTAASTPPLLNYAR